MLEIVEIMLLAGCPPIVSFFLLLLVATKIYAPKYMHHTSNLNTTKACFIFQQEVYVRNVIFYLATDMFSKSGLLSLCKADNQVYTGTHSETLVEVCFS